MTRRDFLTSSLRGLVLGAAISTGLGKLSLPSIVNQEFDKVPYLTGSYVVQNAVQNDRIREIA
jgi:hypothetical protein